MDNLPTINTPEELFVFMGQSTSPQDWDRRADIVKEVHKGYPDFWFATCIMSGLLSILEAKWSVRGGG